jgi:hypothetical protein
MIISDIQFSAHTHYLKNNARKHFIKNLQVCLDIVQDRKNKNLVKNWLGCRIMLAPGNLKDTQSLFNEIFNLTPNRELFCLQVDTLHPREDGIQFIYSNEEIKWLNDIQGKI